MLIVAVVLSFMPFSAAADIVEGGRGMLFGSDHAFAATAAPGWVLDNQSGASRGLHMVFYPRGETWSGSPAFVYGRTISTNRAANVKVLVKQTLDNFRRNGNPNYSGVEQESLNLPNGRHAAYYTYSGDQWGNYEAVVYFQEDDTINFLVFNSRTRESFDKYIDDFHQIIRSYQNLYKSPNSIPGDRLQDLKSESSLTLSKPEGKKYETLATKSVGQTVANAMAYCTSYVRSQNPLSFSYFVRIDPNGKVVDADIFPTNTLNVCFSGMMANVTYPPHEFGSFLLNIEMRITP